MSQLREPGKISIKKAGFLIFTTVVVATVALSILVAITNPIIVLDDDSGDDNGSSDGPGDRDGCGGR
ncbi:MAG: hypothetical protein ACFFEN_08660 [Candidatus Thorarchaeota archaeon]